MKVGLMVCAMLMTVNLPLTALGGALDEGVDRLAGQIVNGMGEGKKQKIAVIEFSDLDGKVTEFGKFLSEELITRLFSSKRFNVVERQLLTKILEEHKLNLSGMVDPMSAKELGRLLGVDAICSGTVTDLVDSVRVNARLISTETGEVFAVASGSIGKDAVVQKLLGRVSYVSTTTESGGSGRSAVEGKVFFFEDFSNVQEGLLPEGWVSGDDVGVRPSKKLGGKKCLLDFADGQHRVVVDKVRLPQDWTFEWTIACGGPHNMRVNGFSVTTVKNKNSGWGEIDGVQTTGSGTAPLGFNMKDGAIHVFRLEKKGPVYRLFSDSQQVVLTRQSAVQTGSGIVFEVRGWFNLYKLVGTELE